jgi:hypothetical protein
MIPPAFGQTASAIGRTAAFVDQALQSNRHANGGDACETAENPRLVETKRHDQRELTKRTDF